MPEELRVVNLSEYGLPKAEKRFGNLVTEFDSGYLVRNGARSGWDSLGTTLRRAVSLVTDIAY